EEIALPYAMGLREAARLADVSEEELLLANPAFLSNVADGRAPIPRGYQLRVPGGGDAVRVASASAPARTEDVQVARAWRRGGATRVASAKGRHGGVTTVATRKKAPLVVVHRVKPGQTLVTIAKQYGTTVEAIKGMNNVRGKRTLQVGQRLRIPHQT